MATFQNIDAIIPTLFANRVQQLTTEGSEFLNSPAVTLDPQLSEFLSGPGDSIEIQSFRDLEGVTVNQSNDDPDDKSVPDKIGMQKERAVRMSRNVSLSAMDLSRNLNAVGDPMDAMAGRVAALWTRNIQGAVIAALNGVIAGNVAGDDDMTLDISGSAGATDATRISGAAVVDAATPFGVIASELATIVLHSVQYATLVKQGLIERKEDPRTNLAYTTFLGRNVIVTDALKASGGVYEAFLLGPNSISYGVSTPTRTPAVAIERDERSGRGSGQSTLHSRVELAVHLAGHACNNVSNPSDADLATAAPWTRTFAERKQIKIVRLVTREA